MGLLEKNFDPTQKQLREFGVVAAVMCTLIGLVLHWRVALGWQWVSLISAAGVAVLLLSRINVNAVRPIFMGMMRATYPIGWLISHLIMGLFYYGMLTPLGLFFRLKRRDPLHRRFDKDATTYWTTHRMPGSVRCYYRQF